MATYDFHNEFITLNELSFQQTSNPLFVWKAVQLCLENNEDFPFWINDYLQNVATSLLEINNPGKKTDAEVKSAIGFKSGKQFTRYHELLGHHKIMSFIAKLLNEGTGITEAYREAGLEFNMSSKNVERLYNELKELIDTIFKSPEKVTSEDLAKYLSNRFKYFKS